jgi:hypothetical protein
MRTRTLLMLMVSPLMVALAGCGTVAHPNISTGEPGRVPGLAPDDRSEPLPTPGVGRSYETRNLVERVCRTAAVPRGWIAVRYEAAAPGQCPRTGTRDEEYAVALIARYNEKPVGSLMVVCADQPTPRNWLREWHLEPDHTCPGARVEADSPTSYLMRRYR